jgi:hypothetical protein
MLSLAASDVHRAAGGEGVYPESQRHKINFYNTLET